MKKYECFGVAGMLTLLGGFLDAYTYTCRDGVFANAQTGNVVKFGIALASGEVWLMLRYAIPILAFVLGVLLSVWFCHQTHGRRYVLLTEGAIVLLVSLMPSSAVMNTLTNVLISFMCALQAEAFRKVLGLSYASTMCTGNLRSLSEALARFIAHQDQQALKQMQQYLLIIGIFIGGVVLGIWLTSRVGTAAILWALFAIGWVVIKAEGSSWKRSKGMLMIYGRQRQESV